MYAVQIQAVKVAEESNSPVVHPIIDKIRQFSSTPDAAVDFFTLLLHPMPHKRLTAMDAIDHSYLAGCLSQMVDDYGVPPADSLTVKQPVTAAIVTQHETSNLAMSCKEQGVVLDMSVYFPSYTHSASAHHASCSAGQSAIEPSPSSPDINGDLTSDATVTAALETEGIVSPDQRDITPFASSTCCSSVPCHPIPLSHVSLIA